jgi:hypothetical protein
MGGWSASGWLPVLADDVAKDPQRRRHCILLWMSGGPTQTDTFDMKPGHANGGEFKEIDAARVAMERTLAKLAQPTGSRWYGDRAEGGSRSWDVLMRTGHPPMGPVRYPGIGSTLSKIGGCERVCRRAIFPIGP